MPAEIEEELRREEEEEKKIKNKYKRHAESNARSSGDNEEL